MKRTYTQPDVEFLETEDTDVMLVSSQGDNDVGDFENWRGGVL